MPDLLNFRMNLEPVSAQKKTGATHLFQLELVVLKIILLKLP